MLHEAATTAPVSDWTGAKADQLDAYKAYYVRHTHLGPGAPEPAGPPDIANVEAYLDELIRVWRKLTAAEAA